MYYHVLRTAALQLCSPLLAGSLVWLVQNYNQYCVTQSLELGIDREMHQPRTWSIWSTLNMLYSTTRTRSGCESDSMILESKAKWSLMSEYESSVVALCDCDTSCVLLSWLSSTENDHSTCYTGRQSPLLLLLLSADLLTVSDLTGKRLQPLPALLTAD